jgi:predicted permease
MLLMIGFSIKRLEIVEDSLRKNLTNLIFYVTLPALVINSMSYKFSVERLTQVLNVLGLSVAVYALMIAVSYLFTYLLPMEQKERDVYQFMLIFANVGFMGYPVIEVIFGSEGVFLAAIYNLVFNLLIWTQGVLIMSRSTSEESEFKLDNLKNPGTFSIGIGLLIFLLSIKLPAPVATTLEMLGDATTPLSMIVVGSILAQIELKQIFSNFKLWLVTALRLVIFPLVVLQALQLGSFSTLVVGVMVVLTGMPVAANTAIFAQEFGGDEALASEGIFLTTLLAMLSIPVLVSML